MDLRTSPAPHKLRIGSVPYLVGRPVDLGFETDPDVRFERAVPSRLVEGLRDGSLDAALVSSIELFRRPGYRYLDRVAGVGRGAVGSVQVFLRCPIQDVQRLALDPSSRAAACLTRVLLAERPGGPPEYVEVAEGEDPRAAQADAWLRIGDPALREHLSAGSPPVFNPSGEWVRRTGLPFVFAAWIIAPGVEIEPHLDSFVRARARGAAGLEELALRAAQEWELDLEACRRYLANECEYETPEGLTEALQAFHARAAAAGECPAGNTPGCVPLPRLDEEPLSPLEARR